MKHKQSDIKSQFSESPRILSFEEKQKLVSEKPYIVSDDFVDLALDELFDMEYPSKKDTKTGQEVRDYIKTKLPDGTDNWGNWVYYSWLNRVVHVPPKEELRKLRTSRNRNLITEEEQAKLYSSTIFIAGMSVGSNIVEAMVSQGIGSKFILADMDIIEPSNLNRIRAPYHHVGLHKVDAISRKVWEIDPYIEIIGYREGLDGQNILEIFDTYPINIAVDEMDSLKMKILFREKAKEKRIPVIMAADNGDNSLLDIDRYDLNPDMELFNGQIPQDVLEKIKNEDIPRAELGMMIGRYFVGADNIPLRMFRSLTEVGKTLPSWPQLGGAAALCGISLAYIAKKILLGEKIKDGRILMSLDEKLDLEHEDEHHQVELKKFQDMLEGKGREDD